MQVILLERIANLGDLGDEVRVKNGFGRNFLIPQGKAVAATAANREHFEQRRAELEADAQAKLAAAQALATQVEEAGVVTLASKAGDEGKLFGSIGARDLVEAAEKQGLTLDRASVRLPEGPLRQTGEYEVALQLHAEVEATLKVAIVAE